MSRRTHIHQPGPVRHRRLALFGERVQVPREAAIGIAARRRQFQEALEFRQDQIQDLRGLNLQHPLLKKERQRIRVLVSRHLQDTLVHRQ